MTAGVMFCFRSGFGLMLLLWGFHAGAQAEIVADLLELLPSAKVTDASSVEVRRPASAGGVKQDALFEHPAGRKAARVEFKIALPVLQSGELLLFSFETALADGITLAQCDGVRFSVEVDGELRFEETCRETRWMPQTIDFTQLSGRTINLSLLTHEIGNSSYDWAVWGSPRIIRVSRTTNTLQNARGLVLARIAPRQTVTIGNHALSNKLDSFAWLSKQFNDDTTWVSPDPATLVAVSFPAKLQIVSLGPARALVSAGATARIRAEIKNAGHGSHVEGETEVHLRGARSRKVPRLAPGDTWLAEWELPHAGSGPLEAKVGTNVLVKRLEVSRPVATNSIQNEAVKIDFVREPDGYAFGRIFGRENRKWKELGIWTPLFRIEDWTVRPLVTELHTKSAIEFRQPALAPDGVEWEVSLSVALERDRPLARIRYGWESRKVSPDVRLWGPNIYVGDGTSGTAKSWGLLPGLEYLYGPERSSNPRDFAPPLHDRRTPHPHQVTIPLMAVTVGEREGKVQSSGFGVQGSGSGRFFTPDSLVDHSRFYDAGPQQTISVQWRAADNVLARFASPNFDENMDNHRLGLFVTNSKALEATLAVSAGPVLTAVREWLRDNGGLPTPNRWPRSFQEELDLCRVGFLKTVSDERGEKFRHCIGWGASHSPGFAALLWLDSRIGTNRESAARVDLVAPKMGSWVSQANCHIMQWEFPFLYGRLAESLGELDGFMAGLIRSQRPDGGWIYEPANKEQGELGRAGDSVLGTCANRASSLLRYARITGDDGALRAGEKALGFMEMFRVPRGGQTWECPMYEPDILAAAYAIRAYHDAYRITGERRWLSNAVYWAETGVAFNYLWTLRDKPMMLGASIPVFGSTFYTHSWLGVPVQWCGLVYAYHVFHLAEELERTPLTRTLGFSPADWKRLVELITVSGMYQQFADGDKIGSYPDSITRFEQRNPAFLNPEDILVNVLALKGYDPDIKTVRVGAVVISSAAKISNAQISGKRVRFELEWFQSESSHTLVKCERPVSVRVNGDELDGSSWQWDEKHRRVYVSIKHSAPRMKVEITGSR